MEELADLVADRVVDALHVEPGGQSLLDRVDNRELRRSLFDRCSQPLVLRENNLSFRHRPPSLRHGSAAPTGIQCVRFTATHSE